MDEFSGFRFLGFERGDWVPVNVVRGYDIYGLTGGTPLYHNFYRGCEDFIARKSVLDYVVNNLEVTTVIWFPGFPFG